MVAQGNALGEVILNDFPALKGHHKRGALFCPFRANVVVIFGSRALPWTMIVIALSAPDFHFFVGAVFCTSSNFVRLFRVSVS